MSLPDYFRIQLPESIREMVDHPDFSPWGLLVDSYTHMVQYAYPVYGRTGAESDTMLATATGVEPLTFEVGQQVCLHGVWVRVASVETTTERADDDGRLITVHTVMVRAD